MITDVIRIAGSGTGAADNDVASIDVPADGELMAVSGTLIAAGAAADDAATAELSFLSTSQIDVNDARGSILQVRKATGAVTTSGQTGNSQQISISFPGGGIPVAAGERIHMHTAATGGVTPTGIFDMYFSLKGGGRPAMRRR